MDLDTYIRDIENFPKPGIVFKDITPLLSNKEALNTCFEALHALAADLNIDKVVGIESRGFFFGTMLANKLNAGFVPVRKPGKLPYTTFEERYELEYGTDSLQMHTDAIREGEHVLIHDDVLATGGTAKAACDLVTKAGGIIVQCNFIMELEFLKGSEKIAFPIKSVVKY
ncbi:adenine phosphoribosyltransferase [Spongiivirga sp. MCCC 1A20706]|uniref:adenine phosphoribosyltransferase n=1 Tax=Spongiivirga sp. MCCC 1A20706 TaxID=3160963 RepID=UPI003977CCBB